MLRRVLVVIALAAGMIPAAYALRHQIDAPRHSGLILCLVGLGTILNFAVLLSRFSMRPALRNLAVIVTTLVGFSIAAGAWQHRQLALEPPSIASALAGGEGAHSAVLRRASAQMSTNLAWIAIAIADVILALLLIPPSPAEKRPTNSEM